MIKNIQLFSQELIILNDQYDYSTKISSRIKALLLIKNTTSQRIFSVLYLQGAKKKRVFKKND